MSGTIFLKQSLRSFRKNWSIVTLIFLFLIVGVSLIVGLSSYLFNAYHLSVESAFKNGSQDGLVSQELLGWTDDDATSNDRSLLFSEKQKTDFESYVQTPDFILDNDKEDFYVFLINNNGYAQSFLYKDNKFLTSSNEANFKKWVEQFKWFNGNTIAYYFKQIIKKEINLDWDVRTTNVIGNKSEYLIKDGVIKTYLPSETSVVFSTFDERWIADDNHDFDIDQPGKSLFSRGDFKYNLKISYDQYKNITNPIFLTEKSLKNFNLKVGDILDVTNTLLPVNAKTEKFEIVGDFTDAGNLIIFSDDISAAIPYTHFWSTIQSQSNYLEFPFFITTNRKNEKGYLSRVDEIQNQIEKKKLFLQRNQQTSVLVSKYSTYYSNVFIFWRSNIAIISLCLIGGSLLIFFVILFTTKQLIENNKLTLQFLKSMGMNNFELSSINMALILLPMFLGFIIAIPGFFIIQNLTSFILENQYPMVLKFWMWNYETVFIFLGTVIFAILVFFLTNFIVLRRHNILEKKESKLIKRIKSGKIRNYIYNNVKKNTKIRLAIHGANLRKNLVTFALLLVTFSVILFGIGFKGSVDRQANLAQSYFFPYKNFSSVVGPLFSEQDDKNVYEFSQQTITETELLSRTDELEITSEMTIEQIANIFAHNLKDHFITSETIDKIIGDDFDQFLNNLEAELKKVDPPLSEAEIAKGLEIVEQLYSNYQLLKVQLEKVYKYTGSFKFVFGRSVTPNLSEVGRTLNLKVKINQRINGKIPPDNIRSIGLIDQNIKNVIGLDSNNNSSLEVKISQELASKLNITKTELAFKKPTFNFDLYLAENQQETLSVPVKVMEIVKSDFTQNAIYYSFNNLKKYLQTINLPDGIFGEQIKKLIDANLEIANGSYTYGPIPNALLNMTIPIVKSDGKNIANYWPSKNDLDLMILDFKIIAQVLKEQTSSYINLINRVMYIFILITIIVSLLLTYLFLVENKQNILLFKSLGYSMSQITSFLITGYIIASIVGVGLGIGASALAVTLISRAFTNLLNVAIPFSFSFNYSVLILILPILFIILILVSLWIYIFKQDPKKSLTG